MLTKALLIGAMLSFFSVDALAFGSHKPIQQPPPNQAYLCETEWPPIWLAVEQRDVAMVKSLLQQGADISLECTEQIVEDASILFVAARQDGNTEIVNLLLAAGADPNIAAFNGRTALMWASQFPNNAEVVEALIRDHANVRAHDITGRTALFDAATADIARLLIKAGVPLNAVDTNGGTITALGTIVPKNSLDIAKVLLNAGANVHTGCPLCYVRSKEMAQLLIQSEADVNQTDGFKSALMTAANGDDLDLVKYLLSVGADPNFHNSRDFGADFVLSQYGPINNAALLRTLVGAGADVNQTDGSGWTALHRMAKGGNLDTAAEILKYGANVNATDKSGMTPLMSALQRLDNIDMLKFLVQSGADLNHVDSDGRTVLMMSIDFSWSATLERSSLLVKSGANVNYAAPDGNSALLIASSIRGDSDFVNMLIQAHADVNHAKSDGTTALMNAAFAARDLESVRALLVAGVDVNATNERGRTALMLSTTPVHLIDGTGEHIVFHPEIISALLAAGARKDLKDSSGMTALDIAKSNDAPDAIIKMLSQ